MDMQPERAEQLQAIYRYAEWPPGEEGAAVAQDFELPVNALDGWVRTRATRELARDGRTRQRSAWIRSPGAVDPALMVELWSCASADDARALLLALLGDMQSPVPASRIADSAVGDVAFALGGNSAVLFARGRIVVRLRNGGRTVVDALPAARDIDRVIVGGKR